MRLLTIITLSLIFSNLSSAQMSLGILSEPTISFAKVGALPRAESDSIRNLKAGSKSISLGIEIRKQIDRYQSITFIPGYLQTNMMLVKEDMQFLDVVHPKLPEIRDFAQAAPKVAYITHRQKYAGTQIIYAKKLDVRGMDRKAKIEIGGGIGAYALLQSDVKIRTEGFAIKDKFTHVFTDSTGLDARPYLIQIILVADLNYELSPKTHLIAGIKVSSPLTSTSTSEPKITIFSPALRIGLRFEI
ncbi:MAG: hypothetical protein COA58_12235 [Bacteroidetes bacterium]|nr:MAG: hypothetical protein COA58_12235 [Bacteroidota bacterium]